MPDSKTLDAVQDQVFADKCYWPKEDDPDHRTFCNTAAIAVARGVGCKALDSIPGREPLLADEIYRLFLALPALFAPAMMKQSQEMVNAGGLLFAILPSWKLQQRHGHVCTLTPGTGDHSGRWDAFTPYCMNLGPAVTCFRRKGVNWAFPIMPEFFVWTPKSTQGEHP